MNINFSFIIPFKSTPELLERVLESIDLIEQKEIIVVDDNSGKDLSELKAKFNFSTYRNEYSHGASYSRNYGASFSQGKYLVFIDSDVAVEKESLKFIVENMENDIDAFEGIYSKSCHEKDVFSNFYNLRIRKGFLDENEITSNCITNFFAVKKSIFCRTDGFNENIDGASVEDIEFGFTLKELGILIFLDKRINLIHFKRHNFLSLMWNDIERSWLWSKIMFRDFNFKRVLFEEGFDHASSDMIKAMLCSFFIILFSFFYSSLLIPILLIQIYFLRIYLKYFYLEKGVVFTFKSYLIFVIDLFFVFISTFLSFVDHFVFKLDHKKKLLPLFGEDLTIKIRLPLFINFIFPFVFSKQVADVFYFLDMYKKNNKSKKKECSKYIVPDGVYDFVVVGAGIGGLTFANEINDGVRKILFIEEGDLSPVSESFSYSTLKKRYRKFGLDFTIARNPISYYVIKGFGGASSINSGICSVPIGVKPEIINENIDKIPLVKIEESSLDKFFNNFFKDSSEVSTNSSWKFKGHNESGNVFERDDFSILNEKVNFISRNKELWKVSTNSFTVSTRNLVLSCGVFETPNLLIRSKLLPYKYGIYFHPMIKVRIRFKENHEHKFNDLSSFLIRNEHFQISMAHSTGAVKSTLSKISRTAFDDQDLFVSVMISDLEPSKVSYFELIDENFVFHKITESGWSNFSKGLNLLSDLLSSEFIESVDLLTMRGIISLENFDYKADVLKSLRPLVNTVHAMGSMYSFDEKFEFVSKLEENGLYISDASVLPGSVGTNPQFSIMLAAISKAKKVKGLNN